MADRIENNGGANFTLVAKPTLNYSRTTFSFLKYLHTVVGKIKRNEIKQQQITHQISEPLSLLHMDHDLVQGPGPVFVHPQHLDRTPNGPNGDRQGESILESSTTLFFAHEDAWTAIPGTVI